MPPEPSINQEYAFCGPQGAVDERTTSARISSEGKAVFEFHYNRAIANSTGLIQEVSTKIVRKENGTSEAERRFQKSSYGPKSLPCK